MRWDYPPLDIKPVFPGLGEIIVIIIITIVIIIIIYIIKNYSQKELTFPKSYLQLLFKKSYK